MYVLGKADERRCWFGYGGTEHDTTDFSWVVAKGNAKLEKNKKQSKSNPPNNSIRTGFQTGHYDVESNSCLEPFGTGYYYSVIAKTDVGLIPGKANWVSSTCTYSYAGKQHFAPKFFWIIIESKFYRCT